MKNFKEYLQEAPFTLRGNAKVHFVTQESKNGKFAKVACGMKAGNKVFTGTVEGKEVTCGKCLNFMQREGLIEVDEESKSSADIARENYLNKFMDQLGEKKYDDDEVDEEAPANAVGAGGVDFNKNGVKKKLTVKRRKKLPEAKQEDFNHRDVQSLDSALSAMDQAIENLDVAWKKTDSKKMEKEIKKAMDAVRKARVGLVHAVN